MLRVEMESSGDEGNEGLTIGSPITVVGRTWSLRLFYLIWVAVWNVMMLPGGEFVSRVSSGSSLAYVSQSILGPRQRS